MAARSVSSGTDYYEADSLFNDISNRLRARMPRFDGDRLRNAYELALSAHDGQLRKDGSPYILHPLEVAEICMDLEMDADSIIAAILHDVVEDTSVRLNQIRQLFGNDVANMVDSLTKIKKIDFFARFTGRNKASDQARNLQKLFVAMTNDYRVIVIKIADRLHNMKTLGSMPDHKRIRISRETLEFYIPIARRLGLGTVTSELEDLVFQFLFPEEYATLKKQVSTYFHEHEQKLQEMISTTRGLLERNEIRVASIYGRSKHLWSIHQKMEIQGVGIDGIYDLLAIRIVIEGQELDCYRVMGLVHGRWKPIFERFRDFVASPKENGYQTLHTTVIGPGGSWVECQIRTESMDYEARQGIAAHWSYKEKPQLARIVKDESWLEFIRELSEDDVNSEEFVARTRESLHGDQVLVLSPRGEVVNLPAGATPVDFAYYIHTNLGHSIRGAKVNGNHVPLNYELRNGDVVEVIKAREENAAPRPEFMMMVRSPKSMLKIRKYFKAASRDERISAGRTLLRQLITGQGLYPLNLMANDKLAMLLKTMKVRSIDEMYSKIAIGELETSTIISELKKIHKLRVEQGPVKGRQADAERQPRKVSLLSGVGYELGLQLAGGQLMRSRAEIRSCCTPVPGDKLYGVHNRADRLVYVHRLDCPRLQVDLREGSLVEVEWSGQTEDKRYPARIRVHSLNRVGLLFEVLRFLSENRINLGGAEFSSSPSAVATDEMANFDLIVEVADMHELKQVMEVILKIEDVYGVERALPEEPGGEGEKGA
ncbi:bifunctional (p)ppGpp synthetase/guanosine-3',5'-bis(diphosphate) 3'-pyrophosphohydrolase [bacterium]|nr:bifunctional (p)ppGpp synthetase/guanosine-3',5'-bis(diphosphate) 3'-pyrophosphohydrolase [bacterium]